MKTKSRSKLIMMCGLPGSGKSTYAKNTGYIVCSSDDIREEFGLQHSKEDNNRVFQILHRRIKSLLLDGKNVVYDATNISMKQRVGFLKSIEHIDCHKTCVFMAVPYEMCVIYNNCRERSIPCDVIERMYHAIKIPAYFEGWDEIIVEYDHYNDVLSQRYIDIFFNKYFDQANSHHSLSLLSHCQKAYNFYKKNLSVNPDYFLERNVCLMHDIGKMYTKTFQKKDGTIDTEAHYYGHDSVGSYIWLLYNMKNNEDTKYALLSANYINYHMYPYFWRNNEKMENKYRKLFGDSFYGAILRIHEADKAAH